ncbi:AIPR family protein [Nitrosomonadaceae bacterium]|nr:AIPR family protein [Nitrosomonadaceae bacterium]
MTSINAFKNLKDRFDSNARQYDDASIDELANDKKQTSKVLARTFALEYLQLTGYEYIDLDVFETGFIDGADDCGVDLLLIDNHRVHIIQAKYLGKSKNCKREDIDTFFKVLERLSDKNVKKNRHLADALDQIDWTSDKFYFWFVTNGKIEGNTREASKNILVIPDELREIGFSEEQILLNEVIDQSKFLENLRHLEGSSDYSKEQKNTIVNCLGTQIIEIDEDKHRVIFMVVEAHQIVNIVRQRKIDLFEYNIRGSLGLSTVTNKIIKKSALENPENFLFFNNGISAICSNLSYGPKNDRLDVTNLQVINGAQTVRALELAARDDTGNRVPKVLIKITEIANFKEAKKLIENMVRWNNTQNSIKTSDFRSNDYVQQRYRKILSEHNRAGKTIAYEPKRMESKKNSTLHLKISMPDFAKAVYAFNVSPYLSENGGNDSLFDTDKHYPKIFGKPESDPDAQVVKIQLAIYLLSIEFSKLLKKEKQNLKANLDKDNKSKLDAIDRGPLILNIASQILDAPDLKEIKDKLFIQMLKKTTWKTTDDAGIGYFIKELFDASIRAASLSHKYSRVSSLKAWQRGREESISTIKSTISEIHFGESLKKIQLT